MKQLAIWAILSLALCGLVAAQTNMDLTWNGAGNIATNFYSGDDASTHFLTGGNGIGGEFHAVDSDNNPYSYSVDNTEATVMAHVVNGGYITYTFDRDASYAPMYGAAGQVSFTGMQTELGGTLDFAWRSSSNYAALGNSNYGFQSNNQMVATGDHFIQHYISVNTGNGAAITVDAVGTTHINDMCDSASTGYSFGKGCGCYTNAVIDTVGAGTFNLFADADHSIVTDTGITVTGGSYNVASTFSGGFHFNNFALVGN